MSCYMTAAQPMAIGPSGRIVVEIDPALKRDLYEALRADHLSLRDWFLTQAQTYLDSRRQLRLRLFPDDEPRPSRTGNEISTG